MVSRMEPFLDDQETCSHAYAPNFTIINARVTGPLVSHLDRPVDVTGKGHHSEDVLAKLYGEAAERVSLLAPDANEEWTALDPLTDLRRHIRPLEFFGDRWRVNSHGCAAHNRSEVSRLLAVEELLERRAVQDWWEGRCEMRPIEFDSDFEHKLEKLVEWSRRDAPVYRKTAFFSITDTPFTKVVAAVSHDAHFDQIAVAFAAGGNTGKVCQKALEELLQVELNTRRLDVARTNTPVDDLPQSLRDIRDQQDEFKSRLTPLFQTPDPPARIRLPDQSYTNSNEILDALASAGCPVLLIDMTHPKIGIPTTRAIFSDPDQNPFARYSAKDRIPL